MDKSGYRVTGEVSENLEDRELKVAWDKLAKVFQSGGQEKSGKKEWAKNVRLVRLRIRLSEKDLVEVCVPRLLVKYKKESVLVGEVKKKKEGENYFSIPSKMLERCHEFGGTLVEEMRICVSEDDGGRWKKKIFFFETKDNKDNGKVGRRLFGRAWKEFKQSLTISKANAIAQEGRKRALELTGGKTIPGQTAVVAMDKGIPGKGGRGK